MARCTPCSRQVIVRFKGLLPMLKVAQDSYLAPLQFRRLYSGSCGEFNDGNLLFVRISFVANRCCQFLKASPYYKHRIPLSLCYDSKWWQCLLTTAKELDIFNKYPSKLLRWSQVCHLSCILEWQIWRNLGRLRRIEVFWWHSKVFRYELFRISFLTYNILQETIWNLSFVNLAISQQTGVINQVWCDRAMLLIWSPCSSSSSL